MRIYAVLLLLLFLLVFTSTSLACSAYQPLYPLRLAAEAAGLEVFYNEATDTATIGEHLFIPSWPDLPGWGYVFESGVYKIFRERLGLNPERRFVQTWPRAEGYVHSAFYLPIRHGRMYTTKKALLAAGVPEEVIDQKISSIEVVQYYQEVEGSLVKHLEFKIKNPPQTGQN